MSGRKQYSKHNEILQLLSQAWIIYVLRFPDGRNYERVLRAICEAQLAVFEEEEEICPGPEDPLLFLPGPG